MTTFHENIRSVLSEIDKFLDALKGEKLSKKVQTNKEKVIELIKNLRQEWPALESKDTHGGDGRDVSNESVQTKGSGNAEDDDTAYGDNVPDKAVKDLSSPVKTGFLEKKRKKASLIQAAFQKRYCVVQDKIFYYFEKQSSTKQAGAFYLEDYEFREAPHIVKDGTKKDLCFELVAPSKRTYQFVAESKEDFQEWRSAITGSGIPAVDVPPIEGEFEDIYEEMPEVVEKAKALAEAEHHNDNLQDHEVYDDAETIREPESEEIYDDVDNVEKAMAVEKAKDIPPPVPPPLSKPSKPALPLPNLPPLPPVDIQTQPLPDLPDFPPPPPELCSTSSTLKIEVNPDEDYDNMYYGKWDCKGSSDDDLSFKRGDIIHVINRDHDNKDWWVGRLGESYGLVPKNYLIRAYKAL